MFRKVKTFTRLLTPLFILLLSVSFFVPIQSPSSAQTNTCPGNVVANGNFTSGLVAGYLGSGGGGAVTSWFSAYGTPDVSLVGHDPGAVGMWGNLNPTVGEGLHQNLGANALVSGRTYLVSIWVKLISDPNKQPYAKFKIRASNTALNSAAGGITVGLTGNITSTAWQQITFPAWTAPPGGPFPFLTLSVENNLSDNDGEKTSYGGVDNICIQEVSADFKATTVCQGQATIFTSNVAGATTWNWNFGDSTPNGSQQNPTHTYLSAGVYNVTLCINGTTNCVTKPVTVKPSPPTPVITGPSSSCGNQTATYSVPAAGGVSYSWSVANGTINGSSTGNSVNVTWNATGGGTISVTVTNKAGCSSSARMVVSNCDVHQGECCLNLQPKTDLKSLVHLGNGLYNFTANLSVNMPNVTRVTADVISSSLTYSSSACGTAGPVNSYVTSAQNVGSFTSSIPVTNGHLVIWYGPATNVGGVDFPFQIKFPPPPSGACRDFLTFCVRYTFSDNHCKSCEVIRCYGPFKRGGPIQDVFDEIKETKL